MSSISNDNSVKQDSDENSEKLPSNELTHHSSDDADSDAKKKDSGPSLGAAESNKQHQQQQRRLTSKTIFVTGLAPGLAPIHLEKLFSKFGTVERLDVKTSTKTASSRYCFCEMDSIENAQKAMDNLNGRMLLHKRLVVQPAHERRTGSGGHPSDSSSTSLLSSGNMDPAKERRILDKKIEELKNKIKKAQGGG